MTTRKKVGFTGHALLLAFVSAMAFSQAASAGPCSAEIDALKTVLNDICWYSRKCHGLSHKLDSTQRKLDKGKFRRAAHKLSDFGWVVEGMTHRRRAKFSQEDYQALMGPYTAVAECIANGGVSAPAPTPDPVPDTGTGGGEEPPPILVQF